MVKTFGTSVVLEMWWRWCGKLLFGRWVLDKWWGKNRVWKERLLSHNGRLNPSNRLYRRSKWGDLLGICTTRQRNNRLYNEDLGLELYFVFGLRHWCFGKKHNETKSVWLFTSLMKLYRSSKNLIGTISIRSNAALSYWYLLISQIQTNRTKFSVNNENCDQRYRN
jgi:hypothetical protein